MAKPDTTPIQDQIWYELEQAKGPLSKEIICQRIGCSLQTFNDEKKALLKSGAIYFCQEGYILKEYATYDQQLWHLAWALGLMEISSQQIVVDEDLLTLAPQAVQTLISLGKMDNIKRGRLNELRAKLVAAKETPMLLLKIYNKVENLLNEYLESKRIGDGKTVVKDLKDLKKYRKDFK